MKNKAITILTVLFSMQFISSCFLFNFCEGLAYIDFSEMNYFVHSDTLESADTLNIELSANDVTFLLP